MTWKAYPTQDVAAPFLGRRGGMLRGRRLLRGIGRGQRPAMRAAPRRRSRRFFCCCPVFFALGVAGLGMIAGFLYAGLRFVGWA